MSKSIKTTNPFNNETISEYEIFDKKKIEECLQLSIDSFKEWKDTSFEERSKLLTQASEILEKSDKYAKIISEEMGKPISESKAEVKKCAKVCRYYAEKAKSVLKDRHISEDSFVTYQPLGPILAVMPWNFPFWQAFRFLAPTLSAGNVALLKHASNVTGSALCIEEILLEAGFPKGVFQTLVVPSSEMEEIIKDFRVRGVSFTGSTEVGRKIGAWAGESLKPSILELGGNDPYIVCEDYDLTKALEVVVDGRFSNTGQSCIAAKRVFVHESKKEEAIKILKNILSDFKHGDPIDDETTLGTLAKAEFKKDLNDQIDKAKEYGARYEVLLEAPKDSYAPFFDCGLLVDMDSKNPMSDEEIFGPVLSMYTYNNLEEAFKEANRSHFGLGGAVFSNDMKWAKEVGVRSIESGSVFINKKVASDPVLPFGGVKNSGYGRELSEDTLFEFVNVKSVSF